MVTTYIAILPLKCVFCRLGSNYNKRYKYMSLARVLRRINNLYLLHERQYSLIENINNRFK